MFTGLVENMGKIVSRHATGSSGKLTITFNRPFDNPIIGESIAINGCCLTLEEFFSDGTMSFHTLEETLKRTNLGGLAIGSKVNAERALQVGARLGGHMVSGHIDATSSVMSINSKGGDIEFKVAMIPELEPFMIEKGSIAIDGVSLTLVEVTSQYFTVHLIPITLNDTALATRKVGDKVNLESDLIGKYVVKQLSLSAQKSSSKITMDTLHEAGFL